ncbi:hypothetical protein [Acaryochloris sp. CCMEE 5410]|uniref:hypothetical protein n=1 Tax=Acaryochloris sp. CCMEE 5410 TaxID=310037 RepID=UPI000248424F|nr:hypothetical protein [Acaryochloris sp. CCMEE 5410]KAI9129041.1 hypothetical protein ON05_037010 [Acaryochloris sp. CCMEE 5410]
MFRCYWRAESGEAVALEASHEEDVSAWVGEIAKYLEKASGTVSFAALVKGLEMPVVVVWLGMVLGGFQFEQRGGFYDQNVWIEAKISSSKS